MPESPLVDAQILGSTRSGEELLHDDGRSPVYYQRTRSRSGHHRCQPAARPLGGQAAGARCGSGKNAVITTARIGSTSSVASARVRLVWSASVPTSGANRRTTVSGNPAVA